MMRLQQDDSLESASHITLTIDDLDVKEKSGKVEELAESQSLASHITSTLDNLDLPQESTNVVVDVEQRLVSETKMLASHIALTFDTLDVPEDSSNVNQCIYRVPPKVRKSNPDAYTPSAFAIGPLHVPAASSNNIVMKENETLKKRYFKAFRKRAQLNLVNIILRLKTKETYIRSLYGEEKLPFNSNQFIEMILTDSCFIIEIFLRFHELPRLDAEDPIFSRTWKEMHLWYDLLVLENQIPFDVIQDIYKEAGLSQDISFLELSFKYFAEFNRQNKEARDVFPLHFVHLLRHFLLPSNDNDNDNLERKDGEVGRLYTLSQLVVEAGLKLKASDSPCMMDIKYENGVLQLPTYTLDNFTEEYLRNVVAFEFCHCPYEADVLGYLSILNLLIKSKNDVNILIDKKIFDDFIGDAKAIAKMVKKLNSYVTPLNIKAKYRHLCDDLIAFFENPRNQYKALLKIQHFSTPWTAIGSILKLVIFLVGVYETGYLIFKFITGLL